MLTRPRCKEATCISATCSLVPSPSKQTPHVAPAAMTHPDRPAATRHGGSGWYTCSALRLRAMGRLGASPPVGALGAAGGVAGAPGGCCTPGARSLRPGALQEVPRRVDAGPRLQQGEALGLPQAGALAGDPVVYEADWDGAELHDAVRGGGAGEQAPLLAAAGGHHLCKSAGGDE